MKIKVVDKPLTEEVKVIDKDKLAKALTSGSILLLVYDKTVFKAHIKLPYGPYQGQCYWGTLLHTDISSRRETLEGFINTLFGSDEIHLFSNELEMFQFISMNKLKMW